MKQTLSILLILLLSPIFLGAQIIYVVNSQSRTLSRIDLATDQVNNSFAQLGNVPNRLLITEDYLYSVNSGDNSLQKISKSSGSTVANHFVAIGSNPWDAILHEEYIYVSGLMSSRVYKMAAANGQLLGSVLVGAAPEDMIVCNGKLYVCNAGNYVNNYAGSSLSVIDLASFSVLQTIPMPANPQFITLRDGLLHVSSTGNWTDVFGVISIVDPSTDVVVESIALGGSPGNIWINAAGRAYVADGSGYSLYSYDANDFTVLNSGDNPLPFAASDLVGSSNFIALLDPNWGDNAIVRVLHPDLSNWRSFTVGMMPTDIKLQASASSTVDYIAPELPALIQVYPSPLRAGNALQIKSMSSDSGDFKLYNLKGQMVASKRLNAHAESSLEPDLASGTYFYRFSGTTGTSTGKILILR